jgi:hypothetical protein
LNADELSTLVDLIYQKHVKKIETRDPVTGKLWSDNYLWDYYSDDASEIRNILDPKIEKLFGKKLHMGLPHMLHSYDPYKLHTDVIHKNTYGTPEYTLLIPVDDIESSTIIFNESMKDSNEFEVYKKSNTQYDELQLDEDLCKKQLSHLHIEDLKYLTLKEKFDWSPGALFAFDRSLYHCGDNFLINGLESKRCIIIWTYIM